MGDGDARRFEEVSCAYPVSLPREVQGLFTLAQGLNQVRPLDGFAEEAISLRLTGPFSLLASGVVPDGDSMGTQTLLHARHRADPPEFFVVATSLADGDRWGYWFDDPAMPPAIAVFDPDAVPLRGVCRGGSLAMALVHHLEEIAERLEEDLQYDPDGEAFYRDGLRIVSTTRQSLLAFSVDGQLGEPPAAREVVAPTVDGFGIVAPRQAFQELLPVEELARVVARGDVATLLVRAEGALKEGYPVSSLQVGKAIYGSPAAAPAHGAALALMVRSYEALGRSVLAQISAAVGVAASAA